MLRIWLGIAVLVPGGAVAQTGHSPLRDHASMDAAIHNVEPIPILDTAENEVQDATNSRLADFQRRLERLEAENARLASQIASDNHDGSILPAAHWTEPNSPWWDHGGVQNEYPTLELSGFVQLDAGWASQSTRNRLAVGDVESKVGLRRTRLRADGRVSDDVSYTVDLDFSASGHPSFRDVVFRIHDRPILQNVNVGYFQQPFGLEATTSGRELLLLERQLPFAFVPFRQTGISTNGTTADERTTWAVSGYRFPTDAFGVSQGDSGGWAYAQRLTTLLIDDVDSGTLVHLGGSYTFIDPGTNTIRYAIEPGFFVVDPVEQSMTTAIPAFVDTGDIAARTVNTFGFEVAAQRGPFHAEAELIAPFVNPTSGDHLTFSGLTTKWTVVLTGESHPYSRQRGTFKRIIPHESGRHFQLLSGAYEAAFAWSTIDLNSGPVQGGELQTFTWGINRYVNSYTKYQLNLIRALLDKPLTGHSAATLVVLRAQLEF